MGGSHTGVRSILRVSGVLWSSSSSEVVEIELELEAALYASVLDRSEVRPEGEFSCAVCGRTVGRDSQLSVSFVQRLVSLEDVDTGVRRDWPAGVEKLFPACPLHSDEASAWARARAGDITVTGGVTDPRVRYVSDEMTWE